MNVKENSRLGPVRAPGRPVGCPPSARRLSFRPLFTPGRLLPLALLLVLPAACGSEGQTPASGDAAADASYEPDVAPVDAWQAPPDVPASPADVPVVDSETPDVPVPPDDVSLADVAPDVPSLPDSTDVASADVPTDAGEAPDVPQWEVGAAVDQIHLVGVGLDAEGESADLTFVLPEDHHSFAVVVEGSDAAGYYMLSKVVTPQGKPIVKPSTGFECIPCQNRVIASHTVAAFLFPNNPEVVIKPGTYVLKVKAFAVSVAESGETTVGPLAGASVDITILMSKGAEPPIEATVDLDLRFTGSAGLTAATAPDDPRVTQGLAELEGLLGASGISVGQVQYFDAPPELSMIETTSGPESDLAALFSSPGPEPTLALQVFFVDQIHTETDDGTAIVLGIAGGIPGPPLLAGSVHSGVVVSTLPPFGPEDHLGTVLTHELGHFLGLFHVVENPDVAYVPDPLSDTPDDDTLNVMWWSVDSSVEQSGKHLSGMQSEVLRRNPVVRP